MFEGLSQRLGRLFSRAASGSTFKRKELQERVFTALVESDVSVEVAEKISEDVETAFQKSGGKVSVSQMLEVLRGIIGESITAHHEHPVDIENPKKKPFVILFLGVNGGGKTTTISKVGYMLKKMNFRPVIAASDTFRAGAIEQIDELGKRTGIKVIKHASGSDPSSVAFDAIEHASARNLDFVLIDTAGRMQNNRNLIEEMKKIKRVSKPDLTLLILDAVIGQDALLQGKMFLEQVGFDGLIVTKLDTDARGGLLISLVSELQKPVYFVCTGQNQEDIMKFNSEWYIDKLLPST